MAPIFSAMGFHGTFLPNHASKFSAMGNNGSNFSAMVITPLNPAYADRGHVITDGLPAKASLPYIRLITYAYSFKMVTNFSSYRNVIILKIIKLEVLIEYTELCLNL